MEWFNEITLEQITLFITGGGFLTALTVIVNLLKKGKELLGEKAVTEKATALAVGYKDDEIDKLIEQMAKLQNLVVALTMQNQIVTQSVVTDPEALKQAERIFADAKAIANLSWEHGKKTVQKIQERVADTVREIVDTKEKVEHAVANTALGEILKKAKGV